MTSFLPTITATSVVVLLLLIRASAEKDTLRLGVLIPVKGIIDYSAFIPTMELALETVSNDTTLPFNFSIIRNDSMVSNYRLSLHVVLNKDVRVNSSI